MKNILTNITGVFLFVLTNVHATPFSWEGLSAESEAENAAILIQGNLPEAKNDIALMDTSFEPWPSFHTINWMPWDT